MGRSCKGRRRKEDGGYDFLRFGEETSISGINNAAKSKTKGRSLVWAAIFLFLGYWTGAGIYEVGINQLCCCLDIVCLQICCCLDTVCLQIVVEFLRYPIITSTDVSHRPSVDFPAVTICNLNRINCHNAFHVILTSYFLISCS